MTWEVVAALLGSLTVLAASVVSLLKASWNNSGSKSSESAIHKIVHGAQETHSKDKDLHRIDKALSVLENDVGNLSRQLAEAKVQNEKLQQKVEKLSEVIIDWIQTGRK